MPSAERSTARDTGWLGAWPGVRRSEPLSRHSQYGIGGPADFYAEIREEEDLAALLPRCAEAGVAVTVIGAGSNALILDGGVRGLVVRLVAKRFNAVDGAVVELSAGYMMPRAALDCARRGLGGLEFGIGVPGTCGASVWGNAGAFGTEVRDVMIDCRVMGPDGRVRTEDAAACGFGYRHSRFKDEWAGHVVLGARLRVRGDPGARARTDSVQRERKASQPYGVRSLGSTFKNPPGDHAGRLIEAAGLKGRRSGGAVISPKHANFILNEGGATAADVLTLIGLAHATVLRSFGVDLEREIAVIGEPG